MRSRSNPFRQTHVRLKVTRSLIYLGRKRCGDPTFPNPGQDVRQAQSAPHVTALKSFLEKQLTRVSRKSPIADAIRYALNHW